MSKSIISDMKELENQWKLDRAYIQQLENDLDTSETERDVLNEDFLNMKDYLDKVLKDNETLLTLVEELKGLRLSPLTYDGENNNEVDNFTAGYNTALEDMRDIIHKYFPREN